LNTNGQKPQTEKKKDHPQKSRAKLHILSIGNYMWNSYTVVLKGVIRLLTKNNLFNQEGSVPTWLT
jgi:hypothetical protein